MSLLQSFLRHSRKPELEHCQVAGLTDVGLVRAANEDSFAYVHRPSADAIMAGVADGMGGHEFGEIASYLVVKYLLASWNERNGQGFESRNEVTSYFTRALCSANDHIFHVNKVLRIRWAMGTTATFGIFWGDRLVVAQVGDSRCYRVRHHRLKQLTDDQNWQAEMVRHGLLTAQEASVHPLSNMLTNCVGALRDLRIQFDEYAVSAGDRYVFCTDGVSGMMDDETIRLTVEHAADARSAAQNLVSTALDRGGNDNVTTVCLFF